MSSYLVNLARRSAGLVPVAHARVALGGGPDARLVQGAGQPSAPRAQGRAGPGPSSTQAGQLAEKAPRDGLAPRALAAGEASSDRGKPTPPEHEVPRGLRLGDPAPDPERGDDPRSTSMPVARPMAVEAIPQVVIRVGHDRDHEGPPDARLHGHRGPEASVGSAEPPAGTMRPRATAIEPAPSPAHVAGARFPIEGRGRGRDVDVRIGTIEIHAEPGGPPPSATPQVATPAQAGRSQGGFDDFLRLRTYAPWER